MIELQNDRSLSVLSRPPIRITCYIEKLFLCRAMFITFILLFISHCCKNIDCTTSRSNNPSTNSTLVANSKVVKISMSKILKRSLFSPNTRIPFFSARENRCVFSFIVNVSIRHGLCVTTCIVFRNLQDTGLFSSVLSFEDAIPYRDHRYILFDNLYMSGAKMQFKLQLFLQMSSIIRTPCLNCHNNLPIFYRRLSFEM